MSLYSWSITLPDYSMNGYTMTKKNISNLFNAGLSFSNVMKLCVLTLWQSQNGLWLWYLVATGNGLNCGINTHPTSSNICNTANWLGSLHFGHTLARLPCRLSDSTKSLPFERRTCRYARLSNLERALALTTLPMTGTLRDTTEIHSDSKLQMQNKKLTYAESCWYCFFLKL